MVSHLTLAPVCDKNRSKLKEKKLKLIFYRVERYISNCGGQRKKNIAVKRIRKVYKVWGSADKLNL